MGNRFCHIELSTDDVDKAKKFYGGLFDWKLNTMPMGDMGPYTMVETGETKVGGGMMGKQMAGQPTAWLAYVEVADVAKTLAKAQKAGANVVQARMEIPGGHGAIGVFIDPQGGALGVWEPGKKAAPKKAPKKADAKPAAKKADAKKADGKKAAKKAAPKKKK